MQGKTSISFLTTLEIISQISTPIKRQAQPKLAFFRLFLNFFRLKIAFLVEAGNFEHKKKN